MPYSSRMRSYGQYCALAKALDVVGDRWTLLIIRELLIRGAARYTDLMHGLPGIATNLLAARLRDLEEAGVVEREAAAPPVATALFRLTTRGEELAPVLKALGRWGAPLLAEGASHERDTFRSHWLALPLQFYVADAAPDQPPATIAVHSGNEPMLIEIGDGVVRARPGTTDHPDGVLTGPPHLLIGVLSGKLDLAAARAAGLQYDGDLAVLRRVRPVAPQRSRGASRGSPASPVSARDSRGLTGRRSGG